jgi:hypothetical protein
MIVKTERAETGKAGNFVVNAGDSEGEGGSAFLSSDTGSVAL